MAHADLESLALASAGRIFNQYREECQYETCRFIMDFRPAILPLLAREEAKAVHKTQREEFARMIIEHFDEMERQ